MKTLTKVQQVEDQVRQLYVDIQNELTNIHNYNHEGLKADKLTKSLHSMMIFVNETATTPLSRIYLIQDLVCGNPNSPIGHYLPYCKLRGLTRAKIALITRQATTLVDEIVDSFGSSEEFDVRFG